MSRGRPCLELLYICSSCKKQKQICNTRSINSEKQFFHKIINFCIGTLRVPCRFPCSFYVRTFRRPSTDVPGSSCAGWMFPMIIFLIVMCITKNVRELSTLASLVSPKNSCESWLFYSFKVLTDRFNNPAPSGN